MTSKLLQLNFSFDVAPAEYEAAVTPLGEAFAAVAGLRWKIWIVNAETREAGGIYLFENQETLGAFLDGPLAAQVKNHPALHDLEAKVFDVMGKLTAVTRGPVALEAV